MTKLPIIERLDRWVVVSGRVPAPGRPRWWAFPPVGRSDSRAFACHADAIAWAQREARA